MARVSRAHFEDRMIPCRPTSRFLNARFIRYSPYYLHSPSIIHTRNNYRANGLHVHGLVVSDALINIYYYYYAQTAACRNPKF